MAKKKSTPQKFVPAAGGAVMPADYGAFLADLKVRVRSAQLNAAVTVNAKMIRLYWDIGRAIVERQRQHGWGKAVVDRLAADVQREFPGVGGFSPQNVWKMRQFFLAYADRAANLSQPVREIDPPPEVLSIPWGHNMEVVFKVKDPAARLWYLKAVTAFGWSRAVLDHHIDTDAYGRKRKAVSNFATALLPVQSDLAREAVKDPFTFGFLTLAEDHAEAELQRGLVDHIRQFLLELGAGFAFVGEQVHLEVGGDDFYLDLVFYHLKLRAFVLFEHLCDGPHNRSSVAKRVMWRRTKDRLVSPVSTFTERHITANTTGTPGTPSGRRPPSTARRPPLRPHSWPALSPSSPGPLRRTRSSSPATRAPATPGWC